jgi:hypothetical protein
MAKEWANKDKYHPSNGVLKSHVQMPRAKVSVRTVTTRIVVIHDVFNWS